MQFIENHASKSFAYFQFPYIVAQAFVQSKRMKGLALLQDNSLLGLRTTGFRDVIPHKPRVRVSDHLQEDKARNSHIHALQKQVE